MAKKQKAQTVSAHLSTEIVEEIDRRAKALDIKRSRYIAILLQKWHDDGAPPVNDLDAITEERRKATDRVENPGVFPPTGPNVLGDQEELDEQRGEAR